MFIMQIWNLLVSQFPALAWIPLAAIGILVAEFFNLAAAKAICGFFAGKHGYTLTWTAKPIDQIVASVQSAAKVEAPK
jgi:hypothetical protein